MRKTGKYPSLFRLEKTILVLPDGFCPNEAALGPLTEGFFP